MSINPKQFAILNKIKSLVKRSGYAFKHKRRREEDISEKIALKIQKNAYALSNRVTKDSFTPPYKEIIDQLQAGEDQIFRAAVFNLTNIAINDEKTTADILEALEPYAASSSRSAEQREYVNRKLATIKAAVRRRKQN